MVTESYSGPAELLTPDGQVVTRVSMVMEVKTESLPPVVTLSPHRETALRVGREYLLRIPERGDLRVTVARFGLGYFKYWVAEVL